MIWWKVRISYCNNSDDCGPVAAHVLRPEEHPAVVHGHVGLWLKPGGQPPSGRPRRALHKVLEEETLVRLAAEGDVPGEGLLDGGQALQGEPLGQEGGVAVVELQRGRLGGRQLLLGLRTAAGLASARADPAWKKDQVARVRPHQ